MIRWLLFNKQSAESTAINNDPAESIVGGININKNPAELILKRRSR